MMEMSKVPVPAVLLIGGGVLLLAANLMGISLMTVALTVPHGATEAAYTMLGVACVAIAHMLNRRANAYCSPD